MTQHQTFRTRPVSRRRFIQQAATFAAALGAPIPFADRLPAGVAPVALANMDGAAIRGKKDLTVLNDRPINAETPAHLLDDAVTPASRLFVRNNGIPPHDVDAHAWRLTVDGEACGLPQTFSLADLKTKFRTYTYQLVIECGGNGRSEFHPPTSGNQWTTGAIGCPTWTGVRLGDVLKACEMTDAAVYVGYYGADRHLSGDPSKVPISRGVPIAKAMQDESLICWAMNDAPLPGLHGFPLRLVCSGWPASTSGKWLNRLVIRDRVHDGAKMSGSSYRVPCNPVAPGTVVPDDEMCIIEAMPVKSLITYPRSGMQHDLKKLLEVRGHAWAGQSAIRSVELSNDFGATWHTARVQKPVNRHAWQRFNGRFEFEQSGYYEVWARATDAMGVSQPMLVPGWNPKGYLNNACHRIAVMVA